MRYLSKLRHISTPFLLVVLFFSALGFGALYIDGPFALKPYMVATVLIVVFLITQKFKGKTINFIQLKRCEVAALVFLLVVTLSLLVTVDIVSSGVMIARLIMLFFVYVILRTFLSNFVSRGVLLKGIAAAGVVVGVSSLFAYLIGMVNLGFIFNTGNTETLGLIVDRSVPRLTGTVSDDPNIAVFYFSIFLCFYLVRRGHLFEVLLFSLLILLTVSRGGYLGVAVAIIYYFALKILSSTREQKLALFQRVGRASIIFAVALCLSLPLTYQVFNMIGGRFTNISTDGGSGRLELWSNSLEGAKDNPILGVGINAGRSYNSNIYGGTHYTHNTYLDVALELGVLGLIACSLLILCIAYRIRRSTSVDNVFLQVLLAALLVQSLFLSVFASEVWVVLMLLILALSASDDKR